MDVKQKSLDEVQQSKKLFDRTKEESVYKIDLAKRIELINLVLENMKDPDIDICAFIESKTNELIDDSIIESDPLDSEIRILDWILYIVCSNQ